MTTARSTTRAKAKPEHVRVNTLDLTLEQLDQVVDIMESAGVGRTTAIVHVATGKPIAECRKLTLRQVDIVEDEDDEETERTDPT